MNAPERGKVAGERAGTATRQHRVVRALRTLVAVVVATASAASMLILQGSRAWAAASPQSLEWGDVPLGTNGSPVKSFVITAPSGAKIKGAPAGSDRFTRVTHNCVSFESTSCSVSYGPVWTGSGLGAGRRTDSVSWAYTNGKTGFAYLSATFLPAPQVPPPSSWVSINDVSVVEGHSGTTKGAAFTVTRYGTVTEQASVRWNTANGTASAGSDYVAVPATSLTFAAGETVKEVSVTVNGDVLDERDEAFTVRLSSPVGVTIADGMGTATIEDDESTYLAIDDVAVSEGDSGPRVATFRIVRTGNTGGTSSVRWATANVSALAGSDYVAVPSTPLTFAAGDTVQTVSVTVTGDTLEEDNETFKVNLSLPVGAILADDSATATIEDDDATYLSVGDVTLNEGSGPVAATVTILRSGKTASPSSVQVFTVNETATAGSDYSALVATTVSFAAGETTKALSVTVNGDAVDEANESFLVRLSSPIGATLSDDAARVTIVDDEGPITPGPGTYLAVSDVSVTEGNSSTRAATFTVSRSGVTSGSSSLSWSTANGSALAGSDYVAVPATPLTFAPDETIKTVSVNVIGDNLDEANETFEVRLTSPTGAVLADARGAATIEDDEATFVKISDVSVLEGHSGTTTATFSVVRYGSTAGASNLSWSTVNDSARAGEDYVAVPSTSLAFATGETTKSVSVTVNGDQLDETDETFLVRLTPRGGATVADTVGRATIDDDDATFLAIDDLAVVEGQSGTTTANFRITRSGSTAATSTVEWRTFESTAHATAGSDYVAVPATSLVFAAGETTKTVSVTVNGDREPEPDERLVVALQRPSGAVIADELGVATIVADETKLVVNDVSLPAIADGTTFPALFTITRSGPLTGSSSVQYATGDGTATAGDDYSAVPLTTVTFGPGETQKRVQVAVNGTRTSGTDDNFFLSLSSAEGAVVVDGTGEARLHEQFNAANCGDNCA